MEIPDRVGYEVGYRLWANTAYFNDGQDGIYSLMNYGAITKWQPFQPITATCWLTNHRAPVFHCTCGLHMFNNPEDAVYYKKQWEKNFPSNILLGSVLCWGELVHGRSDDMKREGVNFLRTENAMLVALLGNGRIPRHISVPLASDLLELEAITHDYRRRYENTEEWK